MTSLMNPTNLMEQVFAIDNLAKVATRTVHLDETTNLYTVKDKISGEVIGQYETYREARRAGH